ncbi:PIN domain-containing protein [Massilia sp. IC2-476]|uniref:PIN domain-containing protein n=1 Tax=Massilia sp. IC2-476 TaxID=2887199 RepID=UPI001D10E175|nr:PIN domain-containing protein [Massilia sp. IC2-476]MCC2970629.1 PIN domain-containing protein [Massilia sp. IC2-476]
MSISHVIIDTNMLIKDARFSGRELTKLVKTRGLFGFRLCLPMVVYDELIGNFRREFNSKLSQLTKAIEDVNKFVAEPAELNKKSIVKKIANSEVRYKTRLNDFIKKNEVIVLPYPTISHQAVVGRMYEATAPFGNEKNTEKGYKDFLILQSISDYFDSISSSVKAILLTANLQDFVGSAKNDKSGIVELEQSFGMHYVSAASSYTVLFQALSSDLADKYKSTNIPQTRKEISEKLENAILSDFHGFEDEILGSFLINVDIHNINCKVRECAVVEDGDVGVMEISGIVEIEITCSFYMDDWRFANFMDSDFIFSGSVNQFVERKGFSKRDEWENEFRDMQNHSEFMFNYIDFDYKSGALLKDLTFDPLLLSLSRI